MGNDTLMLRSTNSAVFLDRDGGLNETTVLNGKPDWPLDLREVVITPGTLAALEALKREEFLVIVVTNQPDVARGKASRADIDKVNAQLSATLPLDAIEAWEHDDNAQCDCGKPKPGMILRARDKFYLELGSSFIVGDRWRDTEAGRRASCRTALIGDGHGEAFPYAPTLKLASLPGAAS
jgi:D-glycero-D-manno-heptose 1,7-bisphosphate phosphatase